MIGGNGQPVRPLLLWFENFFRFYPIVEYSLGDLHKEMQTLDYGNCLPAKLKVVVVDKDTDNQGHSGSSGSRGKGGIDVYDF